ncbi:MAG TPA: thioredoxin domain-containing protein [Thermoanaerobaculia bacterium]|nr:thioredoxin domain-containing protein [Thermoanaerobaculia bacterium]
MSENRLARESSPYLLQHAHNPVDWYPWGEEAFEKARREDKPVFLSIGYSSCHWCHVMERESFESDEVARLLNERFVSVKVDREERPDVDDVYMTAVQLTTGRGGWPLSAFLLPDKKPFFAGTYFPPDDRHGRAGFKTLLLRLSEAFRERRDDVFAAAEEIAREVTQSANAGAGARKALVPELLPNVTNALKRAFDEENGGFGGAPKFPPHRALAWLLDRAAEGDADAKEIATKTLDAMALGGIRDHVGGGFHRYSTDERWLVPHFEKMLTDNAQLLGLYARAAALTGRAFYRRVAEETGDYLLREMRGPEGAFYGATDADSEGEEGKFFVFTEAEIREILGDEASFFCRAYQVWPEGNYHDEATGRAVPTNILHLAKEPSSEEEARLAPLRAALYERRKTRVPPALDDKRVAGWNALAVSGLAQAASALGEPRFLEAARGTARFLLSTCRDGAGRLMRTWKDGLAKVPAFLEDEAYLAHALLDLADADRDRRGEWLAAAEKTVAGFARFKAEGSALLTLSGEGHENLLVKGRDLFDKATPSASGSAAHALVRLARETGVRAWTKDARAAIEEAASMMARAPHGTETWALALHDLFEIEGAAGGAELHPVRLEAFVEPPASTRGSEATVTLRATIAKGWALTGADGLTLDAVAGGGIVVSKVERPAPSEVVTESGERELHLEGTVEARLLLEIPADAAPGAYVVAVTARFVACGDGVCLPARVLSLGVPVEVVS